MKLSQTEKARFESYLQEASEAPFQGWDFSYMNRYGGQVEEPLEWCYENIVKETIKPSDIVLDMGTGGGELLATFQPLREQTYATEAYPPNIPLAKQTLEPLGVHVVGIEEGKQEAYSLPFENNFFTVIINRHESYDSTEVARILHPHGVFITQQVGQRNSENLRMTFGTLESDENFSWNLQTCQTFLVNAGFQILAAKEHIGYSRFYDIRAVVYLLKAIPWEFPDFEPMTYATQLLNIHLKILEDGYFDSVLHRFFIIAQKP